MLLQSVSLFWGRSQIYIKSISNLVALPQGLGGNVSEIYVISKDFDQLS